MVIIMHNWTYNKIHVHISKTSQWACYDLVSQQMKRKINLEVWNINVRNNKIKTIGLANFDTRDDYRLTTPGSESISGYKINIIIFVVKLPICTFWQCQQFNESKLSINVFRLTK